MKAITTHIMIILLGSLSFLNAQTTGNIRGIILDEKKQPLFSAIVKIYSDSIFISGSDADMDGYYNVKNLNSGTYNVHISMMGYQTQIVKNVTVSAGKTQYVDMTLKVLTKDLDVCTITVSKPPVIGRDFGIIQSISLEDITHSAAPHNDPVMLISNICPDMKPTEDGKDVYTRGGRRGTTQFIVDGIKTKEFIVPSQSIGGIVAIPSGIPAEFGDLTGGVVIITTKDYTTAMRQKRMMYDEYYAELEYKNNFLTKKVPEVKKDESEIIETPKEK